MNIFVLFCPLTFFTFSFSIQYNCLNPNRSLENLAFFLHEKSLMTDLGLLTYVFEEALN